MTGVHEVRDERRRGPADGDPTGPSALTGATQPWPRIGLALGGGGVRGLAHIGVLRVLREAGIPVHAIAGTSVGAIVAAAFAFHSESGLGGLLEELRRLPLSPPGLLSMRRRGLRLPASFREWAFARRFVQSNLRGWGVLKGSDLADYLVRVTGGKRLEDSPFALAVVTTDLNTGEQVVLREGPAALALQASCALPGFFRPVERNGHLLGDGGFVNMVPADVVRTMGVDSVIAVDVGQEHVFAEVRNGLEALCRSMEICARHHKRFHLKAADLVIRPEFGQAISALDFARTRHCIKTGIRAGRQALEAVLAVASKEPSVTCLCQGVCECGLRWSEERSTGERRKET